MSTEKIMPLVAKIIAGFVQEINAGNQDPSQPLDLGTIAAVISSSAASMVCAITQDCPQHRADVMLSIATALKQHAIMLKAGALEPNLMGRVEADGTVSLIRLGATGNA